MKERELDPDALLDISLSLSLSLCDELRNRDDGERGTNRRRRRLQRSGAVTRWLVKRRDL
jgi:hypothetical protein